MTSSIRAAQIATLHAVGLFATTRIAEAEPTQYVQVDAMIGGAAPVGGPNLVGAVEGGYRLAPSWWAHGEVAGGLAADDQGGGTTAQLRGGVETRSCSASSLVCGVFGLDLGALRGTWTSSDSAGASEHVVALVAVPRVGIDVGGTHVRARAGIEFDEALAGRHTSSFAPTTTPTGTIGFELAAGMAYQW